MSQLQNLLPTPAVVERGDFQLELRVKRYRNGLISLPQTLNILIIHQLESTRGLVAYVKARKADGLTYKRIANELNEFYNTNLFTNNSIAGILSRDRDKRRGGV